MIETSLIGLEARAQPTVPLDNVESYRKVRECDKTSLRFMVMRAEKRFILCLNIPS